ncbi:uncharacterized protein BJ212DRAFT_1448196 [Suillus subaureus]|uniref:Uncharacterized protein n=1 Tax=Suillus subaureus TaxID=48587 RepID=A0A9P7JAN1_9AGAM|nr:uncharacterized protein BJ212DRAFT_1448196 [Suillus subaureus]KAG1812059.1 hypothetical protein BJ212DRAFT_1448196 [Suillus subaureus]
MHLLWSPTCQYQIYYFTISIVIHNLKLATHNGCPMSDPRGDLHMIHTPLVAWIANYPEQLLIMCMVSKCSLISLATAAQFGDPLPHPPQTCSYTLDTIERACITSDPCNITSFYKTCQTLHLNGVIEPYWKDWGHACPSFFLMPDGLHQWHKFFFDHPINWSINIMGGTELDLHHWKLLPGMIVGAVPNEVVCALHAITEFIFQAQNFFIHDETLHSLFEALCEFHHYKDFILLVGGHHGKNGFLNHFEIPKLDDITECCHITHVKQPYHMSNCRDFHSQCCCFLDWQEKLQFFQPYTGGVRMLCFFTLSLFPIAWESNVIV